MLSELSSKSNSSRIQTGFSIGRATTIIAGMMCKRVCTAPLKTFSLTYIKVVSRHTDRSRPRKLSNSLSHVPSLSTGTRQTPPRRPAVFISTGAHPILKCDICAYTFFKIYPPARSEIIDEQGHVFRSAEGIAAGKSVDRWVQSPRRSFARYRVSATKRFAPSSLPLSY